MNNTQDITINEVAIINQTLKSLTRELNDENTGLINKITTLVDELETKAETIEEMSDLEQQRLELYNDIFNNAKIIDMSIKTNSKALNSAIKNIDIEKLKTNINTIFSSLSDELANLETKKLEELYDKLVSYEFKHNKKTTQLLETTDKKMTEIEASFLNKIANIELQLDRINKLEVRELNTQKLYNKALVFITGLLSGVAVSVAVGILK